MKNNTPYSLQVIIKKKSDEMDSAHSDIPINELIEEIGAEAFCSILSTDFIQRDCHSFKTQKPHIWFQFLKRYLKALITTDPNSKHYEIVRAAFKKDNPSLLNDTIAIDITVRELIEQCKKMYAKLTAPEAFNDIINSFRKVFATDPDKYGKYNEDSIIECEKDDKIDTFFEKDGLFIWDKVLLDAMKKIGPKGSQLAKEGIEPCKNRNNKFKTNQENPISFWINRPLNSDEPNPSKALIGLTQAIIEDITKKKLQTTTETFRVSGHLTDQKLTRKEHHNPSPKLQEIIEVGKWEIMTKQGLTNLSAAQYNAVNALALLLYKNSESTNPSSENFYNGNVAPTVIEYNGTQQISPRIRITESEYCRAYTGKDNYSGAEQRDAKNALKELSLHQRLIIYERKNRIKIGEKYEDRYDRAETYKPLVEITELFANLTTTERKLIDKGTKTVREKRKELLLTLHPIFKDQINTKFIKHPIDLNNRIKIAAKKHGKATSSTHLLIDYLHREHDNARLNPPINEENLIQQLGLEKYEREGRKKLLREHIEKDIQIAINIGLVLSYEITTSKSDKNGRKYIFYLNKDYPQGYYQ